jgi:iron complex outermembrane receptor protein
VTNSGGLNTSGIDATLGWQAGLDGVGLPGRLNAKVAYTHLISGYTVPLPGAADRLFRRRDRCGKGPVHRRRSAGIRIAVGINFTGTYIGESYLDDQLTGAAPGVNPAYRVLRRNSISTTQVRFKVAQRFEFYVGVDNLLE